MSETTTSQQATEIKDLGDGFFLIGDSLKCTKKLLCSEKISDNEVRADYGDYYIIITAEGSGNIRNNFKWKRVYKNTNADSAPAEKPKVSWCYALIDFSALEADCYKVVGYDIYESPHTIYETSDVDKAYNFMNLATSTLKPGILMLGLIRE